MNDAASTALEAKLSLIRQDLSATLTEETRKLVAEQSRRGKLRSGAAVKAVFDCALENIEMAATKMIDAFLSTGEMHPAKVARSIDETLRPMMEAHLRAEKAKAYAVEPQLWDRIETDCWTKGELFFRSLQDRVHVASYDRQASSRRSEPTPSLVSSSGMEAPSDAGHVCVFKAFQELLDRYWRARQPENRLYPAAAALRDQLVAMVPELEKRARDLRMDYVWVGRTGGGGVYQVNVFEVAYAEQSPIERSAIRDFLIKCCSTDRLDQRSLPPEPAKAPAPASHPEPAKVTLGEWWRAQSLVEVIKLSAIVIGAVLGLTAAAYQVGRWVERQEYRAAPTVTVPSPPSSPAQTP